MNGFAFISYSHFDGSTYIEGLAAHLVRAGIAVWYDREIITGDRWATVVRAKLEESSAVIVVMTPAGQESRWVAREIAEAERLDRPILPLLVAGQRFFELADTHYQNVTDGQMPSDDFVERLALLTAPRYKHVDPAIVGLQRRHDHASSRRTALHCGRPDEP